MHGFHHVRARMRKTQGLESFPSPNVCKRALDYLMYAVGICAPLALLPQILQIYGTKSAAGLSLTTWVLLTCVTTLWALYGAVHKDKQICIANLLMTLFNLAIVVGVLLY